MPTQPPDGGWSRLLTAVTTPDGNTQFVDLVNDPNVNKGDGLLYGDIRYTDGSWQGWHAIPSPTAGVSIGNFPVAAPTWVDFPADEVWADPPVFCNS